MRPRATDRDAVIEATAHRIAKAGIQHTTVDDVALEAGVSRATVYRHAGGKHDLVEGALRREIDLVVESAACAAAEALTPEGAVRAAMTAGMRTVLASPVLHRVVTVDLQQNLALLTLKLPTLTAESFRDLLRRSRGSEAPLMRAMEPVAEDLARYLVQMFHTPTLAGDNLDPEAVGDRAANLFGPVVEKNLNRVLAGQPLSQNVVAVG